MLTMKSKLLPILLAIAALSAASLACERGESPVFDLLNLRPHAYSGSSQSSDQDSEPNAGITDPSGGTSDLTSCIPPESEFTLEFTNLSDKVSRDGSKRSCNARGVITNHSNQDMMYAVYRINHYGAKETFGERWMGAGFILLEAGEEREYGRFHRCTGSECGDGEWFYFSKIIVLDSNLDCSSLARGGPESMPELVIPIENPCDW